MPLIIFCVQGQISYNDFKRIFHISEDEMESRGLHGGSGGNFESVPPKPIPELVDFSKVDS